MFCLISIVPFEVVLIYISKSVVFTVCEHMNMCLNYRSSYALVVMYLGETCGVTLSLYPHKEQVEKICPTTVEIRPSNFGMQLDQCSANKAMRPGRLTYVFFQTEPSSFDINVI